MTGKEVQRKILPGRRNNLYHVKPCNSPNFKDQKLLNINHLMQISLFVRVTYKSVSRALRIIIVRYFILSSTHSFYSSGGELGRISNQCKWRKKDHLGVENPSNMMCSSETKYSCYLSISMHVILLVVLYCMSVCCKRISNQSKFRMKEFVLT